MLWLIPLGAVVAALLGGLSAVAVFGLSLLTLPTLTGLVAVLVALLVGIRVLSVDIGWGEAALDRRGAGLWVSVRTVPVGLGWFGHARSRRLVRTRFFTAHLAGTAALIVLIVLAFGAWNAPGFGCAGVLTLLWQCLADADGSGRHGSARQLFTIPRTPDREIVDWWSSRQARAADAALYGGDALLALALADLALADDAEDRLALATSAGACDRLGMPLRALEAAERLTDDGDRAARIGSQANLAWFLARAREAGHDLEDWQARARAALEVAEGLGDRWEVRHTRALVDVLAGRAESAELLLGSVEDQVLAAEPVAEMHLTRAHLHRLRGEQEQAAAAVEDARHLLPGHARVADVERWLSR